MKFIFKPLFAVFCISLTVLLVASAEETELDKLINGLQARYGKMKGLSTEFTQVYRDKSGRNLREQGILILKSPGKMRWNYKEPEEKLFLTDGKKVYFYVPSEKQVTITPIKESDDPRTPFLFLLGRGNLKRDFSRIEIAKDESVVRAGNVVLELLPKKVNDSVRRVFAEINPETLQLVRLALINGSGGRSDFLFSNMKENYLAPDDQFTFTAPNGVKIFN
jgi:outer membrane lipoprotein carrier protein